MNEREWRERFETSQYDDADPEDIQPAPPVSDSEELEEDPRETH